jgi:hypothetical protein
VANPFKLFRLQTRSRETLECELHRRLKLWIYDLRTNKHFALKENPLKRSDLDCKTALSRCGRHDCHRVDVDDIRLVLKAV